MNTITKKSEILFLYETQYNIPNGDPFTGEQRYDTETKKILVSDVRMKRYVRSYLEDVKGLPIYVTENTGAGKTDAKKVLSWIVENRNPNKLTDIEELLKEQIDVRLFGGISTLGGKDDEKAERKQKKGKEELKKMQAQLTGPVQFALLNPSLNSVDLRMHQNTTHFTSKEDNTQGSIATTTIVPYSLVQIHGWINPKTAETTGLSSEDVKLMYEGLWYGTSGDGSSHSRSKIGQNSILLLEIEYAEAKRKIYGVERLISLNPNEGKREEDIRNMDDYTLDFQRLIEVANSDKVSKVKYYTEIDAIKKLLQGPKFEFMEL